MNKKIIIVTVLAIAIGNGVIWFAWEPSPEGTRHELCGSYEAVITSGMNVLAATTELWAAQIDEGSNMVELEDGFYLLVPESQVDGYIQDYRTTEDAVVSFRAMECPGWEDVRMPYEINEPLQYLVY